MGMRRDVATSLQTYQYRGKRETGRLESHYVLILGEIVLVWRRSLIFW